MKTITITEEERLIILYALNDRETRMYRDADAYKRGGNQVAMKDCLNEAKKAKALLDQIRDQ